MSLKRVLVGIFRSQEGTSDRAKDPKMKTRYYNLSKDKAWEEISSTLKKIPGYKVLHEVPSVGEITLEKRTSFGRTVDITVSVLSVGLRCAARLTCIPLPEVPWGIWGPTTALFSIYFRHSTRNWANTKSLNDRHEKARERHKLSPAFFQVGKTRR